MATGLIGRVRAKQAEDAHPPLGRFVEVGGVRLHYIECGAGEPLVSYAGF